MEPPDQAGGDTAKRSTAPLCRASLQWSRLTRQAETSARRHAWRTECSASMEPPDQAGGDTAGVSTSVKLNSIASMEPPDQAGGDGGNSSCRATGSKLQWSRLTRQAETPVIVPNLVRAKSPASMEPPDQAGGDQYSQGDFLWWVGLQWSRLTRQAETTPRKSGPGIENLCFNGAA